VSDISTMDIAWMREALALAAGADLPFGTVIVKDGALLAGGSNSGKRRGDPTAHGEMVAIDACIAAHGAEALQGATLYTSGEPCPMCMGAILWSRIGRVVYAASIDELSSKLGQIMVPCAEIAARTPFHTIEITGGVLADEALKLFDRK
jgi:tRNA(Arg) A34 adenosine deaminase TadA